MGISKLTSLFARWKFSRIFAAISLLLFGLGIILAIVSYSESDISSDDWFLPAPNPVDNWMGPFGAWLALRLTTLAGYFSTFFGLILMLWGVGRFLRWRLKLLAKISAFAFGWVVAVSIPISAIASEEMRKIALGNFGGFIDSLLVHTRSVGKIFISFGIFMIWFFWASGIGFRRPAIFVYNIVARIVGSPKKLAARRKEKDTIERKRLIDENRRRQEGIQKRKQKLRTGKFMPGIVPEELLVPPGATEIAEEYAQDDVTTTDGEKIDLQASAPETADNIPKASPGLQDFAYQTPPIITPGEHIDLDSDTKQVELDSSRSQTEDAVAPTFEPTAIDEEVIVPAPSVLPDTDETTVDVSEKTSHEPDSEIDSGEELKGDAVPPWLITELPEQRLTPESAAQLEEPVHADDEIDTENAEPSSETKLTETANETVEEIEEPVEPAKENVPDEPEIPKVVEPEESPGVEIEPADSDENGDEVPAQLTSTVGKPDDDIELILDDVKFTPPPIGILHPPTPHAMKYSELELQTLAKSLFDALKTYSVEGKITAITPGPIITRFEFEPAPGIKISKISNLADDLALAMKARDVRIVAPLPGRGTVGIEIPNKETEVVYIRSILEAPTFRNTGAALPLALGKGVAGEPIVADLAKMPHLLIAGATGSGKSVCINTIITSLIFKRTPKDIRLLLIDPKRLELSIYNGMPFLVAPVVVEHKEASAALNWGLLEMERRYRKLAEARVRKLVDYNKAVERNQELGQKLPYIVIIIDELADLMMTVSGEIEEPIARLAQMSRAVGIHLVLATQRPSVDVVTGIIKANFPSRIAFKVRSKIDSRTILDMGGAERLLGNGDMLYLPSGFADPVRIHGSFISTEETENLVDYLKEFENPQSKKLSFKEVMARKLTEFERDELFWEAAKIAVISQKGSASHLQRKLRVGYTRAASLIDQLESAGIVGSFEGSKAREVLIKTLQELDELRKQIGD